MRISQGTCVRGGLTGWVLLALALAGCGVKDEHTAAAVASSPKRVICASPAVAEIVFALGGGDRVVGVSEFTDWPPEAAGKTSIGGALSPNRERILALEPDLILAQGNAEALGGFAHSQGIAFLALPLDTLDDLRAAISGFAAALGVKEQGQQRLAEMESGFAAIPSCGPVPVFIAVGHVPGDFSGLMTSGPGTFLDEIVARAGGSNIFSDLQILWPKISQETLIRRKPAVVLDFQSTAADETRRAALVADWERLGFDAGQIRILPEDYLLKPGPRAAQSAARIAEAICQ
ncbi:MAG TPA: cobalamin-binding protein [Verrucomicrobia bacterium]|nr:cobalamin-binding protein [Verrucomicrobiota bacterium]